MVWLIVSLSIVLLIIGFCLLSALPLVRPRRGDDFHSPDEYSLLFEDINLTTDDEINLKGWWIPADASDKTVILLHGHAGTMDPDLKYAPRLHDAGFNVLMFDFRAHGRSGGSITSLGPLETRDVQAAVKLACAKGSKRIGLLGFSMGGRAAILSASQTPQVNAIISDGAPPRLLTAVTQVLELRKVPRLFSSLLARMILFGGTLLTGKNLFQQDPLDAASTLASLPVLFIHGGKDRFINSAELNQMVANAGPSARLWVVPEAMHRNIEATRPEEYPDRIISFFKENL